MMMMQGELNDRPAGIVGFHSTARALMHALHRRRRLYSIYDMIESLLLIDE
jgi:hypothetical protein